MKPFLCTLALVSLLPGTALAAGVPETISYQGVLTDAGGSIVPDGNYKLDFAIYDMASSGTPLWTETHASVPVALGGFEVILGSANPLTVAFDEQLWLGVSVNDAAELSPRVQLTSVAYSLSTRDICLPYEAAVDGGNGPTFKISSPSTEQFASAIYAELTNASSDMSSAIQARSVQTGAGGFAIRASVENSTDQSVAIHGQCTSGNGVVGSSTDLTGVLGSSTNSFGVEGSSTNGTGLRGFTPGNSTQTYGVLGNITGGTPASQTAGVRGILSSTTTGEGYGVWGVHNGSGTGVFGFCNEGRGVHGSSTNGSGVVGQSANGLAGEFLGDVHIDGTLSKTMGSFKIDHPLDPENQYLSHSFVESPDMMNIYNGNVLLDTNGEAVVELPSYFEALNREFRYQLTAIGTPGPNLFVAEEITDRQFKVSGGTAGMKVSWQVTGIRQDPAAVASPIRVETAKALKDRGRYLNPEAYGKPASLRIGFRDTELAHVDEAGR